MSQDHPDHLPSTNAPEPHWPALLAIMAVGGIAAALPARFALGPPWLLLSIVAALTVPALLLYPRRYSTAHRVLGHLLCCSGNTTRELKERWDRDVLKLKPQWVSCMIGTNDVWRQFDMPWQTESHVYPEEYEASLNGLMERTLGKVEGIVLLTPFYLELNKSDAMRAQMDRYGQIVKKTAEKYKTLFVDTQAALDQSLQHYYAATLAWDRVHPSSIGHMVLAKALVDALGFQWNR